MCQELGPRPNILLTMQMKDICTKQHHVKESARSHAKNRVGGTFETDPHLTIHAQKLGLTVWDAPRTQLTQPRYKALQ